MTGLEVLERCQRYGQEMAQLRARIHFARDALTRCTRSADTQGHGGGGDRMGELIARIDMLEQRAKAMEGVHNREVIEAAALCGQMDNAAAARIVYGTMVEGQTLRQMMGELGIDSEATAKSLKRAGRAALGAQESRIGEDHEYVRLRQLAARDMA